MKRFVRFVNNRDLKKKRTTNRKERTIMRQRDTKSKTGLANNIVTQYTIVCNCVGNADIFEIKYRDSGGRGMIKS